MVVAPMPIFIVSKQLSSIICMLLFHLPIAAFVCSYPFYQSHITEILQVLFNGGLGDFQLLGKHFTGYSRLD